MSVLACGLRILTVILSIHVCDAAVKTTAIEMNMASMYCGQTVTLYPNTQATISSAGKVPDGYCGLLIYIMGDDTTHCQGACVSMTHLSMSECNAKVKFTGIHFGPNSLSDHVTELSCWNSFDEPWCLHSHALRVEVLENHKYSLRTQGPFEYKFNVTVKPMCGDEALSPSSGHATAEKSIASIMREKNAESAYRNKVAGILVAVSLASVFLIVLVVTYCYYKHKPFRTVSKPYTEKKPKKGFSGFRAKLSFKKDDEASPNNERYEKTSDDIEYPERQPLVTSAAVATALEAKLDEKIDSDENRSHGGEQPDVEENKETKSDLEDHEPTSEVTVDIESDPRA